MGKYEPLGQFLRDVMKLNLDAKNFRVFSPDENNSNRWQDVLEVTNRAWVADSEPWDDHLAPDGSRNRDLLQSRSLHWRYRGAIQPDPERREVLQ